MGKKNDADHVGIGPGGRLQCNHCGETYNPYANGPVRITLMIAISKAFIDTHKRCPAPMVPLCEFCMKPDHASDDHVQKTVLFVDGWPACGDVDTSSMAIYRHMRGWLPSPDGAPPADPTDLGRCLRLLAAPWATGWRERIGEMARYRGWKGIAGAWAELEALYREEAPSGKAPRLYARMKALAARPDLAVLAIDCSTCHRPMRLTNAGPRGGTWTCDHCHPATP
jgi:hypothetical protein